MERGNAGARVWELFLEGGDRVDGREGRRGRRRKEKRAIGLGKLGNSRRITPDFCSVILRTLNAKIFLHSGRSTAAIHSSTQF